MRENTIEFTCEKKKSYEEPSIILWAKYMLCLSAESGNCDYSFIKYFFVFAEKREKYDNGEDPLDPEQQGNQGFNPFHHHFHGSPFQFKFHFN